jgi:hypothetical protein
MYWATSFCEREKSSKRSLMYADSVWWAPIPPAGTVGAVDAARFMACD